MRIAALVTWVAAAFLGAYLLRTWLANRGLGRAESRRRSRFAPGLVFGHGGLAASGLGVWIAYLVVDARELAWTAFAILLAVAGLGTTMFGLWLRGRGRRSGGKHEYAPRHAAEDHFPPPAVLAHGGFAVTTLLLVLLTALQVGG